MKRTFTILFFFLIISSQVFAFDIAIYGDVQTEVHAGVRQIHRWVPPAGCDSTTRVNLFPTTLDQKVYGWYRDMGINLVETSLWFPSDLDRITPYAGNLKFINIAYPGGHDSTLCVFKYLDSQYRDLLVAIPGRWIDSTNWELPNASVIGLFDSSSLATGPLYGSSTPHDLWKKESPLGQWNGWDRMSEAWWDSSFYMPMYYTITWNVDPVGDISTSDTLATFNWLVKSSTGWWLFPTKALTLNALSDTLNWVESSFIDSATTGTYSLLDEDFNFIRSVDWSEVNYPNWRQVRMWIRYQGTHNFYLNRVQIYDEGAYRLFAAPNREQWHASIAADFRAQMNQFGSIMSGWYYDEWDPEGNQLPSVVKINQILKQNNLPTFYVNGHYGSNTDQGAEWNNLTLLEGLDSVQIKIPLFMHEFYPMSGDSGLRSTVENSILPSGMYTLPSSDALYINAEQVDGTHWQGTKSLQCAFDASIWGYGQVYELNSPPIPFSPYSDANSVPHIGLLEQVEFDHGKHLKSWALTQGSDDDVSGDIWPCCPIRYPSKNEVKAHAWLAVACDVDGVMWYPWELGGLLEYHPATVPGSTPDQAWWCDSTKDVVWTERAQGAKEFGQAVRLIAPILESLDFIKTYASRAFEQNYAELDCVWIARDILHGSCLVDYLKTYAPVNSVITPTTNIIWSSEPELNSYVQISRFMTPGVSDNSEDYWFLVVNRRALANEVRKIKIGIDSVSDISGTYFTQRLLDGTSVPTLVYGTGNLNRYFELVIDPGDAELVHFIKMDTTDLVYDDGASHTLLAPLYLNRNVVVRNAKLIIKPNMAAIMDSFWVNGTQHYKYDSTANVCFGPGKGIIIEDGNPSHRDPDESKVMILGNDTTRIALRPLYAVQHWVGIQMLEGTRDSLILKNV